MSQPAEGWAVYGIDLPEAFVFPVTNLGVTDDVRGLHAGRYWETRGVDIESLFEAAGVR